MDQQQIHTRGKANQNQYDDWNEVHQQMLEVQANERVQKKSMEISNPGDADEEEADTVARKVINGESATINGSSGTINRKGEGSVEASPEFQSRLQSNKGSGQSLPSELQQGMGSMMGTDFSNVKIHTGSQAASLSSDINAKAFASGNDIYFNEGQYDTQSKQGQELIAHELVHTVQQGNNSTIRRSPAGHEPGSDYSSGTITATGETYPKQTATTSGKNVYDSTKTHALYFKSGAVITREGASTNNMWVQVKGTAHYKVGQVETAVAGTKGWVPRRSTSMALGLFEGLPITNETSKTGPGAITSGDPMGKVNSIVLHQTDGSSYTNQLNTWKKGGGVGAQYLIGEDGQMALVVPINERVGHVKSNRDVVVKEPKVADPAKVTDAEMKSTRESIDGFYNTLNTANIITKDLHDYYAAMDSQTLYNTLKANKWQLNFPTGNTMSIGIEIVHRHSYATYNVSHFSDKYSSKQMVVVKQRIAELVTKNKITAAKKDEVLKQKERDAIVNSTDKKMYPDEAAKNVALDNIDKEVYASLETARWKIGGHVIYQEMIGPESGDLTKKQRADFFESVKAKNLSPELKAQILKTEQRDKLAVELSNTNTTVTRKGQIEDEIDTLNIELFNFMAAYDFMLYEDISGEQKYSLWLLVSKLIEHYSLDPMQQVVGHEDVDKKVVGEGQNEAEFIRTMTEFTRNVKLLNEMGVKEPALEAKNGFLSHWKYERGIIASIDNGETDNATVLDFFNNFYTKTDTFNNSGALKWIKLYQNMMKMDK